MIIHEDYRSMKFILLAFCFIFAFSSLSVGQALAATYYVSPTGSDSGSGSLTGPFKTVQKAANVVNAGDTVLVRAGTYAGFKVQRSGTSSNWIVFKPYPGESVTIDAHLNTRSFKNGIEFLGSQYIEINGFTIIDSNPLYDSNNFSDYSQGVEHYGIRTGSNTSGVSAGHLRLTNLTMHHIGFNGIYTSYSSEHIEITDSHIYNTGLCRRGAGIYLGGSNHTVARNIIHDSWGIGIHAYVKGVGAVKGNIIDSNKVYNSGSTEYCHGWPNDGSICHGVDRTVGTGIYLGGGNTHGTVINNISYNNVTQGISVSGAYSVVINNTSYGNRKEGIITPNANSTVIVRNNIVYLNGSGGYPNYSFYSATADHNLLGIDPKFVNPSVGNFHLEADSPAIRNGDATCAPQVDHDNKRRPKYKYCDIGAYEY